MLFPRGWLAEANVNVTIPSSVDDRDSGNEPQISELLSIYPPPPLFGRSVAKKVPTTPRIAARGFAGRAPNGQTDRFSFHISRQEI
jgi:hypothetical protein